MPYKMTWYIDNQIIYADLWGDQSLEELHQSNSDIVKLLETSDGRLIHIIIDDTHLKNVPLSLMESNKALTYTRHEKLGWVVMIGNKGSGVMEKTQDFLVNMMTKIARVRFKRLKTLDEAIDHLKQVDVRIEWDKVNSERPTVYEFQGKA